MLCQLQKQLMACYVSCKNNLWHVISVAKSIDFTLFQLQKAIDIMISVANTIDIMISVAKSIDFTLFQLQKPIDFTLCQLQKQLISRYVNC